MQLGDSSQDRSNVEDRRGFSGPGIKLGLGGTLVLLVLGLVFKTDLLSAVTGQDPDASAGRAGPAPNPETTARGASERGLEQVAVGSFNDVQRTWTKVLPEAAGSPYRDARTTWACIFAGISPTGGTDPIGTGSAPLFTTDRRSLMPTPSRWEAGAGLSLGAARSGELIGRTVRR